MPQEPKKRHSRGRKGKRRASIKLSVPKFGKCSNCKGLVLSHKVCKNCGYYNGKQVMEVSHVKKRKIEKSK
jgi:large subunit ribosomal protein L32